MAINLFTGKSITSTGINVLDQNYSSSEQLSVVVDYETIQKLIDFINKDIEYLFEMLTEGRYDELSELYSYEKLNEIVGSLYQFKGANFYSEKVRTLYSSIAKIIYDVIEMYRQYLRFRERSAILENSTLLKEYIEDFNERLKQSNNVLIEVEDKMDIMATLKPEYSKYIELYGLPDNLDWNETYLNRIRLEIYGTTNVYTDITTTIE